MTAETKNVVSKSSLKPDKITNSDLIKSWIRWVLFCETSHSYERLQSLTFCYAMIPILEKLYKKKEEFTRALTRHLLFFNTQGIWGGGTVLGITIALEEQRANALAQGKTEGTDPSVISSTKIGLMGPFAGIGDSIDWATLQYLLIAIAIPWAQSGFWFAGVFPFVVFSAATFTYGFYFLKTGYRLGMKAAENMLKSGTINKIIEGMSVLGLFMMGILASKYVKLSTPLKWNISGKEFVLQTVLDKILPGILPFTLVSLVYLFFMKRGLKVNQILLYVIVIFFVLGLIGIF